jgi:NitT/TauT family transport system substrate-binding protein
LFFWSISRICRIIARGDEAPSLRGQTIRGLIVNADVLAARQDAVLRFMRAYRESLDWMFSDPRAVAFYAARSGVPERFVKQTADEFQTKPGMQLDQVSGIDGIMAEGVKLKFLDAPLTKEQLSRLIQIPPP